MRARVKVIGIQVSFALVTAALQEQVEWWNMTDWSIQRMRLVEHDWLVYTAELLVERYIISQDAAPESSAAQSS